MVVEANLFSRVARVFRSYANAIGVLCTSTSALGPDVTTGGSCAFVVCSNDPPVSYNHLHYAQ